jgi:hypothetical protein
MGQMAKEKIRKIIDGHRPEPLLPEVDARIDRILRRAAQRK